MAQPWLPADRSNVQGVCTGVNAGVEFAAGEKIPAWPVRMRDGDALAAWSGR
jgi:hypothetical protein